MNDNERVIDLKDLLLYLKENIKKILIFSFILSIVLCIAMTLYRSTTSQVDYTDEEINNAKQAYAEYTNAKSTYDDYVLQLTTSALNQLSVDDYVYNQTGVILYNVDTNVTALFSGINNFNDEELNKIYEVSNFSDEITDMSTLVSIDNVSDDNSSNLSESIISSSSDNFVFLVEFYGPNQETVEVLKSIIEDHINSITLELQENNLLTDVKLVGTYATNNDTYITSYKSGLLNNISEQRTVLANYDSPSFLNDNEIIIYQRLIENDGVFINGEVVDERNNLLSGFSAKVSMVSIIAGFAIVLLSYLGIYIFNSSIMTEDDLKSFGIDLIDVLKNKQDRLLLCKDIENIIQEKKINKLFICSDVGISEIQDILELMNKDLSLEHGNPKINTETYENYINADGIILFVKKRKSERSYIKEFIEIARRHNIEIIRCVLF